MHSSTDFVRRFLRFFSPFLAFFGLTSLALFWTGEDYRPAGNLSPSTGERLVGYEFNEDHYPFLKWNSIRLTDRKKVLALGSSRVLQFRQEMFDSSFFNAGYAISSLSQLLPFLKSLPEEKQPELVIAGLDQWMFNAAFDSLKLPADEKKWTEKPGWVSANPKIHFQFFQHLLSGAYPLHLWKSGRAGEGRTGLNAWFKNSGFRCDGSMRYGLQTEKLLRNDASASDAGFAGTLARIKDGNRRFEYGKVCNPAAFQLLDSALRFCSSRNIKVICFLPPFAGKVLEKMDSTGKYAYMKSLRQVLPGLVASHGYEFYDFSGAFLAGSPDTEMLDGFHGSESTYLRMLLQMSNKGSIVNRYTTAGRLSHDLQFRQNRYSVYRN